MGIPGHQLSLLQSAGLEEGREPTQRKDHRSLAMSRVVMEEGTQEGKGAVGVASLLCASHLCATALIFTACGKYNHLSFIGEEIEVYRD